MLLCLASNAPDTGVNDYIFPPPLLLLLKEADLALTKVERRSMSNLAGSAAPNTFFCACLSEQRPTCMSGGGEREYAPSCLRDTLLLPSPIVSLLHLRQKVHGVDSERYVVLSPFAPVVVEGEKRPWLSKAMFSQILIWMGRRNQDVLTRSLQFCSGSWHVFIYSVGLAV